MPQAEERRLTAEESSSKELLSMGLSALLKSLQYPILLSSLFLQVGTVLPIGCVFQSNSGLILPERGLGPQVKVKTTLYDALKAQNNHEVGLTSNLTPSNAVGWMHH